jgi:ubiquinone/menaquinone biosynthesis C-methylase UbiE
VEDTRTTAARTHFDRWSETYEQDSSARWLREVQAQALAALALTEKDVLLDVGCGTGAAVRDAAPTVTRAVGFDLSPGMIAQAKERAAELDNVEFRTGDVSGRLPFADAAFTALVCTTAFHHFPRPTDTIKEMARVLAPSGRLVIADANRRHAAVFALDLVLRVAQPSHAGFRSPRQLMHDLCAAGFARVSYCTTRWRSYAFVRAEKALR